MVDDDDGRFWAGAIIEEADTEETADLMVALDAHFDGVGNATILLALAQFIGQFIGESRPDEQRAARNGIIWLIDAKVALITARDDPQTDRVA